MWLLILALAVAVGESPSSIKKDEVVTFFPTFASFNADTNTWEARIHGWIYEPEERSWARNAGLRVVCRLLKLDADSAQRPIFQRRARLFLVDNQRGKNISIRIGEKTYFAGTSHPNGHFEGTIPLSAADVARRLASQAGTERRIAFHAVLPAKDERDFAGVIDLIDPTGISVISDIDDTIKVTAVADRKALLANTFLYEFKAVPGMADVYRRWRSAGAHFHYVSASPWQLYQPLADFLRDNNFPEGTFHLKVFRLKDSSFLELFESPLETKHKAIVPILEAFPHRRFILVGDSGEKDPEIYGELARAYPQQILHIYIRNVTGEKPDSERFQNAFKNVDAARWQVFSGADELAIR